MVSSRLLQLRAALRHRWFAAACVLVIGLLGTSHYAKVLAKVYPIDTWLFWQLGALWAWMAVFSLSCLCAGQLILTRVMRVTGLPALESAVQSMAVGVVAFVMCMYAGGALGLFGPIFAVALPLVFAAAGASSCRRLLSDLRAELAEPRRPSAFVWLISAAGVVCVALVYLGVMTPDSLNYDSTWSHLVIAQDYARNGRLITFPGNYNMGVPHLASLIHTWGFTVPGLDHPALRWMMALHNEFGLFLWTLAGVAAGVKRLLDEPKLRGGWTAFFLFPSIFVYDSNLGGAADHIAAFFAVPILLAGLELWSSFTPGRAALLATVAAGAMLTKYQAAYLFAPLALLLGARLLMLLWRRRRGAEDAVPVRLLWLTPLVLAGLGALLVSPHFIKNAVFYGNPLYPFAQEYFAASHPVPPGGDQVMRWIFTDDNWRPKGTTLEKLKDAFSLFFTFSYEPHYSFTGNVPNFGSLFTFLLPLLLVLRSSFRIWFGAILASGAVLIWAYTYLLDRNLQIFMPIMVCVTAALLVRGWRLGRLAQVGLVPLVGLQLSWGADAPFYSGSERFQSSFSMIRTSFEKKSQRRLDGYRQPFLAIKKKLPEDARVLLHMSHVSLGIDREVIMDWAGFQGHIHYDQLKTVRELYDHLKERGITHLLYEHGVRGASTKQAEVLFQSLLKRSEPVGTFGVYRLLRMPKTPPPEAPYQVATISAARYPDGLWEIDRLNVNEYLPQYVQTYPAPELRIPKGDAARAEFLERADAVFLSTGTKLGPQAQEVLNERFAQAIQYGGHFSLYLPR